MDHFGLKKINMLFFSFSSKVKDLIRQNIHEMIDEAKYKVTLNEAQPKKPLIRLRILYQKEKHRITNEKRFGQQYQQQVFDRFPFNSLRIL